MRTIQAAWERGRNITRTLQGRDLIFPPERVRASYPLRGIWARILYHSKIFPENRLRCRRLSLSLLACREEMARLSHLRGSGVCLQEPSDCRSLALGSNPSGACGPTRSDTGSKHDQH